MWILTYSVLLLAIAHANRGDKPLPFTLPPLLPPVGFGIPGKTNDGQTRPVLTPIGTLMDKNERFQDKIDQTGELPKMGKNLLKLNATGKTAMDILKKAGSKGTVLRIENYSGRLLAEPIVYTRCGYEHEEYPVFETLEPATSDIAILHNNGELRSSCGSISWQVMQHAAKPYTLMDGRGVRLFLTWSNLNTMGSNRCKDGKRNEFIVGFQKVTLDAHGKYEEDSKKKLYKTMHKEEVISRHTIKLTQTLFDNKTSDSLGMIVSSPNSELEVRAEMGTGCLTELNIQILGKRSAELDESDLGITEAKTPDEVWEQMIRQSWFDIVKSINRDKGLYGIHMEPLLIDPLMKDPIYVNTSVLGYDVEFLMWNVSVAGLSHIKLDELVLERGDALKNLDTRAVLNIGNLTVKGRYQYKAIYNGWMWGMEDMDSGGAQDFIVDMTGAKLKMEIGLETVDGCERKEDLILNKVRLPLDYEDVEFDFKNIGTVLSGVVNVIGEMALQFSEDTLIDVINDAVRKEIPTFLCEEDYNITALDRNPVKLDKSMDDRWKFILENETSSWGLATLRRDILAEKFIKKVFNDGVANHFADPNDPLVKMLDPFQMLPVNEDFRSRGLVKGHVVVCDFWLYDLRKLQLLDIQLARNEELTYSALKVKIGLPTTSIKGKYRLNNVRVLSRFKAPNSEGDMDISLTGVTVDLHVILRTKPVRDQGNATIAIELFEVEFGKKDVKFNITGLAKGMNKITNKIANALGNKILAMQKEVLNTEIKNIIYGLADCLMYKPGMGLTPCLDAFWESLGFEVPFTFPACKELYNIADKKLGLI